MLYLITYDVPSTKAGDRRRARLAKHLEGLALRVQFSVFEMEAPPERLPGILANLEPLLDAKEDSLRIYPLCGACAGRAIHLGRKALYEHGPLLWW